MTRLGSSSLFAWSISFLLHGLLFLGFYSVVIREASEPRVLIIPEARLAPGPIGPGAAGSPLPPTARQPEQPETPPVAGLSAGENEPLPVISIASGGEGNPGLAELSQRSAATGITSGAIATGSVLGSAVGAAGVGGGGGGSGLTAPASTFFGQVGTAYKVVYVVDLSASLMIYMNDIAKEMRESIRNLLPTQRFHIVLAKASQIEEFPPRRLVPAIAQYKKMADGFLQMTAGVGAADPAEAMRRAFAVKPELIYFLTDGDYGKTEQELEKTLRDLNPGQRVKITVIGFDPSPKSRILLERIAREHGGNFRAVQPK